MRSQSKLVRSKLVWSMMCGLGLVACEVRPTSTSSAAAEEIGICGANLDPTTGVVCHQDYQFGSTTTPIYVSGVTFEKDGFDYVRCTWKIRCFARSAPRSPSGAACTTTVGTGCAFQDTLGTFVRELQLPPGTMEAGKDKVCKDSGEVGFREGNTACAVLDQDVEQFEDLCCLPRVVMPDAGVGSDAGSGSGSDASTPIDAGGGSGSDAGLDAGFDAGSGSDAGSDGGVDAGSGSDAGIDGGYDAGSGSDAGSGDDAGIDGGSDAGLDGGSCPDAGWDAGDDAGLDASTRTRTVRR